MSQVPFAYSKKSLPGRTVLSMPAVSIPIPNPGGLPVGAQLVGAPGGDATLLAMAETIVGF